MSLHRPDPGPPRPAAARAPGGRRLPVGALPVLAALLLAAPQAQAQRHTGTIRWIESPLEEILDSARATGSPVLAVFGAEWCGWCRQLERETLKSAVSADAAKDFMAVAFDVDSDPGGRAAARYGVQGLPAILVIDSEGRVSDRIEGFLDVQQFVSFLRTARLSAEPIEGLLELARSLTGEPERLVRVGRELMLRGEPDEGRKLLERAAETGETGDPAVVEALLALSAAERGAGDLQAALRLSVRASEAAAEPQGIAEAFTTRIRLLRELGRREEQLDTWRRFARRLPDDPTVREDLARAMLELGGPHAEALEAADRAAALAPEAGGPHACRAEALYRMGRLEEALEAATRAIELSPEETASRTLRIRIIDRLRGGTGSPPPSGRRH